jgi:myosin-5
MQIQYNVSRLETWCSGNGYKESAVHLKPLAQLALLLTMKKITSADMDAISSDCFLLNQTQIKNLLKLWADLDSPVSPDLLHGVLNSSNNDDDPLLLHLDISVEFVISPPREIKMVEKHIPEWIQLPYTQAVLSRSK